MAELIHRPLVTAATDTLLGIFRDGHLADRAIEYNLKHERRWGSRDRRFFAETVYDITRWWRRLNWLLGQPGRGAESGVSPDLSEQDVWSVVAAYVTVQTSGSSMPAWLEVSDAQAKEWRQHWASKAPSSAIEHSLPDWLEDFSASQLNEAWPDTIRALNTIAPVFLRVNRLRTDRAQLVVALAEEGILTEPIPDNDLGLRLTERKNVFATKAFAAGHFEVQDGGSQQIAPLVDAEPGQRVIDACAGAGGKTLHLASLMKNRGKVIALDVHDKKLGELRTRASRAGVDIVETRLIESRKVIKRLIESADRVLLDVPCSGSGVWRRYADSRWRITLDEIARLRNLQTEILRDYSKMAKPGGAVVYATCSLWPCENQMQVQGFLENCKGQFTLESEITISPSQTPFDGFYAARLLRK
ncbi:MAG: RsmB/NOP family class I SAM-dependent RNA methyltransferase [Bdellovibrionales bacterium]